MPTPRFQFELEELDPDSQNSKHLEVEDATKQQSVPQQSHGSGESICSTNESLIRKGDTGLNSRGDCEIRWEDLQLREEIGQGKA